MTQDEIDKAWSDSVASIAASTLQVAKLLPDADYDRVREIIAEEILVRLILGDRPNRENWRYKAK